ncbi:MAG TPA: hypothetical protein VNT79_07820, partial [Phycisphaerae bacterium]|nr:hypothetical protein [Phycisphaerae bacterium]
TEDAAQEQKQQEKAQKYLAEGQELLGKGNIVRAKVKFKSAYELGGPGGAGDAAIAALLQIHERGRQELEAAQAALPQQEFLKALREARRIKTVYSNLFGGIEVAPEPVNLSRLAAKLIEEIESNPSAQPALQEEKAAPFAKRIERLEREREKDRSKYVDLFAACEKAAEKYPASPTGKAAAARLKQLKANKKIWRHIGRERDRRALAAALSNIAALEKHGRPAEAQKHLDRLLTRHPGQTRAALEKRAKQRVK